MLSSSCHTCDPSLSPFICYIAGPLTSHGELRYHTFSIRFQAGRTLAAKSGYYADWFITERSASAASPCSYCDNYCYHGYEYADEACASSCQCVGTVVTGTRKFVVVHFYAFVHPVDGAGGIRLCV